MGGGCSGCPTFSAVNFLSPQPKRRLFQAVLDYSGPQGKAGEGRGEGWGQGILKNKGESSVPAPAPLTEQS